MASRDDLLQSLRGKQVVLPDLYKVFEGWPKGENPYYRALKTGYNRRLDNIFGAEARCRALKGSQFPFFAATFWPNASYEELRVLMCLTIWLFTWDDEIDEPTGSCSDDMDAAQVYRAQTVDFVSHCLGFEPFVLSEPTNKIVASFRDVGIPIAEAYTLDQRKRFLNETTRFLEHSQQEQRIRLSGRIPTIEEYWAFRMGTSAVGIILATIEYANQVRICNSVMQDSRIKIISDETIIIISIVNDLLSLKKEVRKGCIDNVVPIYCSLGMGIQEAVDEAVRALTESKNRFDKAAASLLMDAGWEPLRYKHVVEWIEGCKHYCVGNVTWSLVTDRYGMTCEKAENDGNIHFLL